ncbi:tetratricopeptide repeat protein [Flavobacterium zepuense]|uniref:Tetratricopeptide repeat protein n=1 Tax=Flavobacterium zepuense TaxID=2593302 RepID=A0A552V2N9_9FLAO|nr:histidine kinase [Flavobacterium zepuense]TRW24750.1 tetratricopeptide repeat protein [Flavobacterium zepuense]
MRFTSACFIVLLMLLVPKGIMAQDTIKKSKKESPQKQIKSAAKKLESSFEVNDDNAIAKNYELLADGFTDKGDYAKAEEYLGKALALYTKLNNSTSKARVFRNLAKVQELQNKISSARSNYKVASENATSESVEQLNSNDFNRLRQSNNPVAQDKYVKDNIQLLDKENKKEEVADAYVQEAKISLQNSDKKMAIESYKKAIPYAESASKEVSINKEIAKIYTDDNLFTEAINITRELLQKAEDKNDYTTQITQLQSLASIYFKQGNPDDAVKTLREAYTLASQKGRTTEVKKSLGELVHYYRSKGNDKAAMALYEEFFSDFERLIHADSTLTDAKALQVTEEKIRQLEKEKVLKDELISRKNTFNYFLLGSVLLLILFFGFIVKALYSIKTKNKEIALQSLRREMNPHFIFNSLNSVNQFIAQNNELEANKYLTSYSNLMRNTMENSNKDFVTLANETEHLKKYLGLEHMRFKDKFDFTITVDDNLDPETTYIPNMIIQPHLENAIWHGLRYKEDKGLLQLSFALKGNKVIATVEDDGIGITRSSELKTENQKVHQSRGITNTKERITLLGELYKKDIAFNVSEKELPLTGTVVQIVFPLINKI